MVLAADAVAVAFPDEAVGAHAPAVALLPVSDAPDLRVEGAVLLLGDGGERDLVGVLRVTDGVITLLVVGLLRVFSFLTSGFRVLPEPGVT